MTTKDRIEPEMSEVPHAGNGSAAISQLLHQYGCGPIQFVGTENAFYERHLVFDRVIEPEVSTARERFEAFAHSVRDILAQRWVRAYPALRLPGQPATASPTRALPPTAVVRQ